MLNQIGVNFDLLLFRGEIRHDDDVLEDVTPGEHSDHYVVRVARAKAAYGVRLGRERNLPSRLVLAADTTLDVDGEIIGKPRNAADAVA
ncbi:MAG TPA: Maf family protein, partial [Rhodocyclaceae bacterium]|nr:Maf family protein [Rhodocyclaceae bacterium]